MAVLTLIWVCFICCSRRRRRIESLPRKYDIASVDGGECVGSDDNGVKKAVEFEVIPIPSVVAPIVVDSLHGLVPRSSTNLYPVRRLYMPNPRYDGSLPPEIQLSVDDVVHIQHVFNDNWALGSNVTTGGIGVFPLVCLADTSFRVPDRIESIESSVQRCQTPMK